MKEDPVITLITDFGLEDEYVGVMKGVILSMNRHVSIVDVTHHVPRHDIIHAALALESTFSYFPRGSIHVVVVDPGVGSRRNILCGVCEGHYFLAPDNGVLQLVLRHNEVSRLHAVTATDYYLMPLSSTFHGRDIFAPVAAHLSRGVDVSQLGKALSPEALVPLDCPEPRRSGSEELTGCVMSTDHFGNLITNIRRETLEDFAGGKGLEGIFIRMGGLRIKGVSASYDAVSVGSPVAVVGSKNRLEISINQSDASAYLETQGDIITVTLS